MENLLHKQEHGFECLIYGEKAVGKIQIGKYGNKPSAFLCQNTHIGSESGNDKFGYKFEWCIGSGNKKDLIDNSVTNFKLINENIIHEIW